MPRSSRKPCPPGCIARKPCPEGKAPAVICRSKTPPRRNPWKQQEVARLRRAIEEMQPELKKYYGTLDDLMRLSLTPPSNPDFDVGVVGENYRHNVRGNVWAKGMMPQSIFQIVNEMTKRMNIEQYPDPFERFDHIVGGMKYSRDLKSVVTVKECVMQLCLLHWRGSSI